MVFPSLANFLKALWRFAKRPELTPEHIEVLRRNRCGLCTYNADGQCLKCTCFIGLKTKFSTESCPEKFWGEYFSSRRPGI
jgi:hypothetical protein